MDDTDSCSGVRGWRVAWGGLGNLRMNLGDGVSSVRGAMRGGVAWGGGGGAGGGGAEETQENDPPNIAEALVASCVISIDLCQNLISGVSFCLDHAWDRPRIR